MQSFQPTMPKRHEVTLQRLRSERRSENDRLGKLKASLHAKIQKDSQRKQPSGIRAA